MKPILSCKFNMDTACVELKFLDGTMLAFDIVSVVDEVVAIYQKQLAIIKILFVIFYVVI